MPGAHTKLPLPFSPFSPLMGLRSAAFEAARPASEPRPQPLHRRILHHHDHHHHFQSTALFITVLACAILVTVLLLLSACLFFLYRRFRLQKVNSGATRTTHKNMLSEFSTTTNSGITGPDGKSCLQGGDIGPPSRSRFKAGQVFTYKELEVATGMFSEQNVIGNDGFGLVYRGILGDGNLAAIKMLNREGKQGEREFRVEVDLLSRLHYPFLVQLLGYCADHHHRLLVFEYMPNGSLQHHLHPSTHKKSMLLNWGTRLRIALDCARGLEFLHEHSTQPIIHRDFKCSNILLDHNFRAKVSDFGLAKMGSDKINGQVATRVLGTNGYVAPEYASTGKLTTKSDVYSYGVVLLQLLTGRVPVDTKRPPGEHVLVSWALPRLTNREKVENMIDPSLEGQFSKKELIQVAAIAAMCVQSEADYRPLMTDVVQSLVPLVRNFSTSVPNTPSKISQHKKAPMP